MILEHMVTFRREIKLWRETGVTQRALMIRDDADTQLAGVPDAAQPDHRSRARPSSATPGPSPVQRRIDVDLFIISLQPPAHRRRASRRSG